MPLGQSLFLRSTCGLIFIPHLTDDRDDVAFNLLGRDVLERFPHPIDHCKGIVAHSGAGIVRAVEHACHIPPRTRSGCAERLGFENLQKLARRQNADVLVTSKCLQVSIARHEKPRSAGNGRGDYQIIFLVFSDTLNARNGNDDIGSGPEDGKCPLRLVGLEAHMPIGSVPDHRKSSQDMIREDKREAVLEPLIDKLGKCAGTRWEA